MAESARGTVGSGKIVSVAIAVIRRERLFLICRRKSDAVLANFWEFPGGKIETGETPEACAVREAAEEIDLHIRPIEKLSPITHIYDHATILLTPVVCDYVSGDATPIGCAELKWVRIHQLTEHAFPPANATLINDLIARFS